MRRSCRPAFSAGALECERIEIFQNWATLFSGPRVNNFCVEKNSPICAAQRGGRTLPGKLCGRRMPRVREDLDFSDIHVGFDLSPSRNRIMPLRQIFPLFLQSSSNQTYILALASFLKRFIRCIILPLDAIVLNEIHAKTNRLPAGLKQNSSAAQLRPSSSVWCCVVLCCA